MTETAPPVIPADETEAERARRLAGEPINPRSEYRPEFCQVAKTMRSRNGATLEDIAEACGVSKRTLQTWSIRHPEFEAALEVGKKAMVGNLENSLYRRALGYEVREEKTHVIAGKIRHVDVLTHVPANPACLFFALENLDPANWRNPLKLDPGVKPAEVSDQPMTPDEWDRQFGSSAQRAN